MVNQSEFSLKKHSIGVGDRFGYQGVAQLAAVQKAVDLGLHVTPVWNKSFREHQIIGTTPQDQRQAANQAIAEFGWQDPYFVDADHINLNNVDGFLAHCDFFTIDVGKLPLPEEIAGWPGQALADSITHRPAEPLYNRHMRQLMHVAYKLAAEKKERFFPALERCRAVISQRVTENLFVNHLQPLFIG